MNINNKKKQNNKLFNEFDDYHKLEKKNSDNLMNKKNNCIDCKSDKLIVDFKSGNFVCTDCGQVNRFIIDNNPEWNRYDNNQRKTTRCTVTTNYFLPESSLGTSIGGRMNKLKKLHNWSAMPYKERSLNEVLTNITNRCFAFGITENIISEAKIMYKEVDDCKHNIGRNKGKKIITRGTNRKGLIAACVFYACKKNGKVRSSKEIALMFNIKETDITKGCKTFISLRDKMKIKYKFNSSYAHEFVSRYCRKLRVNDECTNLAKKIAINTQKLNIAPQHNALSIAAGSILIMSNLNHLSIKKQLISVTLGVSDVTITKTLKRIELYLKVVTNDTATNKLVELLNEKKGIFKPVKNKENKKTSLIDEIWNKYKKIDIKKKFKILDQNDLVNKCNKTGDKFLLLYNNIKNI